MKWPWQRDAEDDGATVESEGDEGMGRGYTETEEWDDEQDEGAEEGEPEADELAELDEDTRALVTAREAKAAAAARAEQQAAVRDALRERGFDLSADGTPLIADPAKVREFALGLQREQAPPKQETPATPPPTDEEPEPDIYSEPEQWKAWNRKLARKEAAAVFEERFAQLAPRLEQTEQFQMSVQEERALSRVMELLPDAPGTDMRQLAARENRERFQAAFVEMYRGVPAPNRARLSDDDLETLAAATITKVLPRQKAQRDDRGRYASPQSVNARLYGESWQPHPDGSRAPQRRVEPSEEERAMMKRYGMTEKELAALAGPAATLSDYRAAQAKAKK